MIIDGHTARAGVDPLALPLDRFCNLVYAVYVEHLDEKDRRSFDATLDRPLPGRSIADGPWSDEEMSASFRSLSGEVG